jgi:hypothetical protein
VLAPVGFDDDFAVDAGEIGNEWSNCHLSPELESAELPIAKMIPEPTFGIGGLATEPLCVRIGPANCGHGFSLEEENPSPNPLPRTGEGYIESLILPASG